MKVVNLTQGSQEWHAHRAEHFNASDAPVMMGASKKKTRTSLLHLHATGDQKEVSAWVEENLFAKGHETEALARPLVEEMIGEELFPVVGVSDEYPRLSASFDGVTDPRETGFEHKLWNEELAESVRTGAIADDPAYFWQLEQQLLVGGLQRVIFTVSDGTAERMETYTYTPRQGRAEQLLAGWAQFEKDLAAYTPAAAKADVVAAPVETLPAIVYTIDRGTMALQSNLPEFKAAAAALIERTKAPMVTDQDFADRDAMCKAFREAEKLLKMKADEAVGQISDVAAFARELNDLSEKFRAAAIASEKLIDAEKTNRKNAILAAGKQAMAEHMHGLNARLAGRATVPAPAFDLAAAAKNKRTLASVQDAVDTAVAQAKIVANASADLIATNLAALDEMAPEYLFLFRDLQNLVAMPAEAFRPTVAGRVLEHKAKEEARLQAERERIAREEREKAEREARARVEAEERARREEEQRQAKQQAPAAPAAPAATTPAQVTTATPAKTGGMREYAELRKRPTANELVNLIATTYQVSAAQALEWLTEEFSITTALEG